MSRIARAWISSISSSAISDCWASDADADARISAMTSSIRSMALSRAETMCIRSCALRRRNRVRRTMTSIWWVTQYLIIWSSRRVRGTPSTSASMLAPNVSCSWVCLYRLFSTTLATASRFSTMTSRWPRRSLDSSRMSAMPVRRPSRTRSPIFSARLSRFTWNGSSVATRQVRPWISSTSTTARMTIEPRPVRYASLMPRLPTIRPLVGKSGPLIRAISASRSSSSDASKLSRYQATPSATSRRLCGGILVAMPTAMPSDPLMSRLGNRLGSTTGSDERPS